MAETNLIAIVLHALIEPGGDPEAARLPVEDRRAAAFAVLTAYQQLRRGDEKLRDVYKRVGERALIEEAERVAA